jgi:hypothetical protein|nr:MAG TPA: hypothetical protein [Caudoviricetes sp.]
MRYHYEKPKLYSSVFGIIHTCNHPVYDRCTLYLIGRKGLAVIQLCADKNKVVEELGAMDCLGEYTYDIETKGTNGHVYTMNDLVFYGFTSKLSVREVANMLKQKMYKTKIDVVGGTIILYFE